MQVGHPFFLFFEKKVGHPSATSSQSTYDYGPCYALIQYDYIPRSKISKTI